MKRFLSLWLLPAALFAADQNECPWINAATAAGIIGAPVQTKTAADRCEFVAANPQYVLRVEVKTASSSSSDSCGPHAQTLSGIGNEAVACLEKKPGQRTERILGRVRDRSFVISLSTADNSASDASLLSKAKSAAEQVAGNLF
ncbi:MAG TPA: hypothetical protein VKX25_00175 [Bryobacteraceae bacterium]|nr:hypothetical protein [Bryobacteraceae bacterium]